MSKSLRRKLVREINNLEKNYRPSDVDIIDNLLKQVYKIIRTDEPNVYTNEDSSNKANPLNNKQLTLLNEEDKL